MKRGLKDDFRFMVMMQYVITSMKRGLKDLGTNGYFPKTGSGNSMKRGLKVKEILLN